MVKKPPANAGDSGDVDLISGLGRAPGEWQPTPVFFLEDPRDRGAWQTTVHGVTKSQT